MLEIALCAVQLETIRVNVLGMLNLADLCLTHKIHLTTYATGCIFHYDVDFPEGTGKGFTELDTPNFTGSYYSHTKASLRLPYPVKQGLTAAACMYTILACWEEHNIFTTLQLMHSAILPSVHDH